MPAPLINWKVLPESPPLSTTAATMTGWFQLLYDYITGLAANPDLHWEVCSYSVAGNPHHLVLKRKDGSPGRILFMGITASVNSNYNPQLSSLPWTAANSIRWAYFPEATSDVPNNLLSTSGDVFTNPNNYTSLASTHATFTSNNTLRLWSSSAGIILRQAVINVGATMYAAIGDLLVRYDDTVFSVSINTLNFQNSLTAIPAVGSTGGWSFIEGDRKFLANSTSYTTNLSSYLRNNSTKTSAYLPIRYGSLQGSMLLLDGFKLRQIHNGPAQLAPDEIINIVEGGVPVSQAIALSPTLTANYIWLLNQL